MVFGAESIAYCGGILQLLLKTAMCSKVYLYDIVLSLAFITYITSWSCKRGMLYTLACFSENVTENIDISLCRVLYWKRLLSVIIVICPAFFQFQTSAFAWVIAVLWPYFSSIGHNNNNNNNNHNIASHISYHKSCIVRLCLWQGVNELTWSEYSSTEENA